MAEVFEASLLEARAHGRVAVMALWRRELTDLVSTGIALRLGSGSRSAGNPEPETGERRPHRTFVSMATDARAAWRGLRMRPAFAMFAALTLALGIGSATAVYSTLEAVVLRPLPFDGGERLVQLFESSGSDRMFLTPSPDSLASWREQTDIFEAVELLTSSQVRYADSSGARLLAAARIRPGFHALTGQHPILGRSFSAEELLGEGAQVAMLGHAFWRSAFNGDRGVLGRVVQLDGSPWTVIGVMPPRAIVPVIVSGSPELWLPLDDAHLERNNSVVAVMREGLGIDDVEARFEELGLRIDEATGTTPERRGTALSVAKQRSGALRDPLRWVSLTAGFLVLIACINVANLLIGAARRGDLAVRVALGASRANIVRQTLFQSLLLATLGAAGGVVLARWGISTIVAMRPERLGELDAVSINASALWFTVLVTAVAGVCAGVVPALSAARNQHAHSLRRREVIARGTGRRVRWLLISGEVALSFVLLVGAILMAADLRRHYNADFGFAAEGLTAVGVSLPPWKYPEPEARAAALGVIEDRLRQLPGVSSFSASTSMPPRTEVWFGVVEVDGEPATGSTDLVYGPAVDEQYFATLGHSIVAGRSFSADEIRAEADVVILAESTARKFFGDADPLGRRFRVGDEGEHRTIIGVARDVAMNGPKSLDSLQMYRPAMASNRTPYTRMFILRADRGEAGARALLEPTRAAVLAEEPDILLYTHATATELMGDTLQRERFVSTLMAGFSAAALLLAAVGLYGVVSQLVGQRTREFGIRMALGAEGRQIRAAATRNEVLATVAGVVIGVPLLWACTRLSGTVMLQNVGGYPFAYVVATLVLLFTAVAASLVPARRAARIDPVRAIRAER